MDYVKGHGLLVGGAVIGLLLALWILWAGISSLRADGASPTDREVGGKQQEEPTLGSASSPSVVNGCMDVNGVITCSYRTKMYTASTTLCQFKAPSATSTLRYAGAKYTIASTSATISTWAKGATYSASTTLFGSRNTVAASAQLTHVASSTVANSQASDFDIAPNTFFGLTLQGGENSTDLTGLTPNGICEVEYIIL